MIGTIIRRRSAFTLVETVVSMATMSVLMTGMGSAILLASRALPGEGNRLDDVVRTSGTIDLINSELQYATTITAQSPTSLTFTVFRDGADRQIIYNWAGTVGAPLTRKYAALANVDLLGGVQDFAMTYDSAVLDTVDGPDVEGAEKQLSMHDAVAGQLDYGVMANQWVGQYLVPALSADAVSWSVTRVKFMAMSMGPTDGVTLVQLRPENAGLPTPTVLEQVAMNESDLSGAYEWVEFSFANVNGIAPDQGLCLVLEHVTSKHSCEVQFSGGGAAGLLEYDGTTWTAMPGGRLLHYIYGKETIKGTQQPGPERLLAVTASIQAGADASTRVEHNIPLLNQPPMP